MISTQPGSTPLASFKIVTIDAVDAPIGYSAGNDIGSLFFIIIFFYFFKN